VVDLKVTTTNDTDGVLGESVVEQFKESLGGELPRPGETGYDEARTIHNGMIDRHPALSTGWPGPDAARSEFLAPTGRHWFFGLGCSA